MRDGRKSSTKAPKELTAELEKETLGTLIATGTAKHHSNSTSRNLTNTLRHPREIKISILKRRHWAAGRLSRPLRVVSIDP